MKRILPRRRKVQLEVTDDRLTARGGLTFLKAVADGLGLFKALTGFLPAKRRQCGESYIENIWALVAAVAGGDGSLQDQDRLKNNRAERELLG